MSAAPVSLAGHAAEARVYSMRGSKCNSYKELLNAARQALREPRKTVSFMGGTNCEMGGTSCASLAH